jgi:DNA-binding response OmpR family regulator
VDLGVRGITASALRAAGRRPLADRRAASAGAARRVLVTDDEPSLRTLVRVLLEREHFDVLEARSGREAVEIARRERPDLLLIDLNMPDVDGYRAIAQARREHRLRGMPIVVLTSQDNADVRRRVFELGADDVILKPFDAGLLLARVQAWIQATAAWT